MDKKVYRKFSGRRGGLAAYSSIWLAVDHMLVCEDSLFIERYKRFYFKDIQALTVKKTDKSFIVDLVFFVLTMASFWFLAHAAKGWNIFWGIIAALFFFNLVINIFKGQNCKVFVQTAVQEEELKGLDRVKKFEKFLKMIRPLIQSFQGEMDPQILETKYEEYFEKAQRAQAHSSQDKEQDSLLHTALFLLFFVWSFLIGAAYFFNNGILHAMVIIIYAVLVILNILAVVKQLRINIKPAIRVWAWVSMASMGIFLMMGYIALIIFGMESAKSHRDLDLYSNMDILRYLPDNHIGKAIILIAFVVALLLGIVGLLLSARPRSKEGKL